LESPCPKKRPCPADDSQDKENYCEEKTEPEKKKKLPEEKKSTPPEKNKTPEEKKKQPKEKKKSTEEKKKPPEEKEKLRKEKEKSQQLCKDSYLKRPQLESQMEGVESPLKPAEKTPSRSLCAKCLACPCLSGKPSGNFHIYIC